VHEGNQAADRSVPRLVSTLGLVMPSVLLTMRRREGAMNHHQVLRSTKTWIVATLAVAVVQRIDFAPGGYPAGITTRASSSSPCSPVR
jgi:hypothetical protein